MSDEDKSITIVLDTGTELKLRTAAIRRGVSVEDYCAEAINRELGAEKSAPAFSAKGMIASGKAILKGRLSVTDSADLIRDAREERHRNL